MPLPLIILGASLLSGGAGLATGSKGVKKISDANREIKNSEKLYNEAIDVFREKEAVTNASLEKLRKTKLVVWQGFERFTVVFEKIKNSPSFEKKTEKDWKLEAQTLDQIKQVQISAIELFGPLTAAVLGGGSLTAGGGGIALSTQVLGAAVAAPVLAVTGLLLNKKGSSSLKESEKIKTQVDEAILLMKSLEEKLLQLKNLSEILENNLSEFFNYYNEETANLELIVSHKTDYNTFTNEEKKVLDVVIKLVSILYNTTTLDLMVEDEDGSMRVLEVETMEKIHRNMQIYEELLA